VDWNILVVIGMWWFCTADIPY